ncbi:MAG: exodeoxyribonuclease V subunit beta [Pseudomonadota bacterium]
MNRLDLLQLPLAGTRLVEASAGTGKTHAIATLYLRLVLGVNHTTPRRVQEILVVTFTRAATGELRDRIRRRLYEALDALERLQGGDRSLLADDGLPDAPLRELLMAVNAAGRTAESVIRLRLELATFDDAAIFTIHGFCQRALQEQAFDSGEGFELEMVQDDSRRELQAVQDHWRARFYGNDRLAALARSSWQDPAGLHRALAPLLSPGIRVQYTATTPSSLQAERAALVAAWRAGRNGFVAAIDGFKPLQRGEYKPESVAAAAAAVDSWCHGNDPALPADAALFLRATLDEKITPANRKNGVRFPPHPLQQAIEDYHAATRDLVHTLLADAATDVRARIDTARRRAGAAAYDDLVQRLHTALHGGNRLAGALARRYPVALIDEFQDTDPLQYELFSRIYRDAPDTALLLIGDPKQAIYSFRGADIFAYLRARREAGADNRYSLDTNWRSVTPLVDGVNALFGRQRAPFLFSGAIDFEPVHAAARADRRRLAERGAAPVPLEFWSLPEPEKGGPVSKEAVAAGVLPQLARRIATLLADGTRRNEHGAEVPLAPRDIAVLVRTNDQGADVQAALRRLGIGSAMTGTASVFAGEEATDLRDVLQAIADPASDRALRRALASPLWPHDASFIAALDDDSACYESLLRQLHDWRALWLGRGFMPMFRAFLHQGVDGTALAGTLLARAGGERRLTNLLQIAELLQQAARAHPSPDALLRWLDDAIAEPDGNAEEQQLRLESDEDLVQVLTLHRSKGLEYPVVFLPFMHDARPVDPAKGFPRFHDDDGRRVVDLAGDDGSVARADYERLAEDLRLLYVALTRAQDYCIVPWGRINKADTAALASLLHGPDALPDVATLAAQMKGMDHAAVRAALDALAARYPASLRVVDLAAAVPGMPGPVRPVLPMRPLSARPVARRVQRTQTVASYSALLQDAHDDTRDVGVRREAVLPAAGEAAPTPFTLRGGTVTGHLFHDVLETIDYADDDALQARVVRELADRALPPEWSGLVSTMIRRTLDTPLDDSGFRLRTLTRGRRINEMEFWCPAHGLRADALEALLPGLGAGISGPRLSFAPLQGYLQGFIDLVFEHDGRWYVADWKTNKLGPDAAHYAHGHMAQAIVRHRYDLQYTLYLLALHRHLRQRLGPQYDPARQLGGVYYLFLRGLDPDDRSRPGIWHVPADHARIARLDAMFRGETP